MGDQSDRARWVIAGTLATALIAGLVLLVVPWIIPKPEPYYRPDCTTVEEQAVATQLARTLTQLSEVGPIDMAVELALIAFTAAGADEQASVACTLPGPRSRIRPYELVIDDQEEEDEERDDVERQIVSINAPATDEPPVEARFEDRVDRDVDEETVARDRGDPGLPTVVARPTPQPVERRREREPQPEAEELTVPQPTPPRPDSRVAVAEEPELDGSQPAITARVDDPNRPDSQPVEDRDSRLELSAFNPTFESAEEFISVPGMASPDYLNLPQGDRTQVDSFENMYWSYWDRIKNQVRPHWLPARVYRERDPTGRVFGVEDRYTVLRVTLNGDGSLRHVFLERSSDLDFLDREAIRAIRAAEPFSNVPEGLKDESGLLSFRFGFYFEVSSRSFRIRREDW